MKTVLQPKIEQLWMSLPHHREEALGKLVGHVNSMNLSDESKHHVILLIETLRSTQKQPSQVPRRANWLNERTLSPRDAQRDFLTEQEKRKTGEGPKKCDSL